MSNRYYDSYNSDGEIKPGKISKELREALNLSENDVPLWIYRMRALGYPPGWLKKAIVDTDDIFDTDNSSKGSESRKRKNPSNDEVTYDHAKLIEYPGFNVPLPKNCIDYHYYVNMPSMLDHQQLEYAKKHMNAFKPAQIPKRIRTTASHDESNNSLSTTLEDPESPPPLPSANTSSSSKVLNEEIKLVSKGSPMPKPVERAPLERFSQGVVGELLYFENLPTSTGKFDSIRGLLNTIRKSKSETDNSFLAEQ